VKPDDVCVLWVDNLGDGTTFQRLRIDEQGEFIDRWPMGFFSERAEELF
jgi:predicted ATPase